MLEELHVGGVLVHLTHRHLVGAPVVLRALAVDLLGTGPALGRAQDDHGPARTRRVAVPTRVGLDPPDLGDDRVEGARHELVHLLRFVTFDEIGRVTVASEEMIQLLVADAGQHRRVRDLVAVEVQDRQHSTVQGGVEELVGVPARGQRSGLGLAVAHHAGHDQIGVVEGGAVGVGEGVAQLAALVDGARRLRGDVARDATGERELLEQPQQAVLVLADVRIDLAVGALQVGVGDETGSTVPGTSDVEHAEVVLLDHPVQVGVEKVQARRGTPVAEEAGLDVLLGEGLFQEGVVVEVDLPHREIVGRAPVGIDLAQLIG